jgi:hypothetical protein
MLTIVETAGTFRSRGVGDVEAERVGELGEGVEVEEREEAGDGGHRCAE